MGTGALAGFLDDPKVEHTIKVDFEPIYIAGLALFLIFLVVLSKKL